MEMEDGDIPPFWQPPATMTRRHRHRSSSPLLNSSLLIILLPSITLVFTVFIVIPWITKILPNYNHPITSNNTPQNQKAISVKKSWDLLNIILVLFAILCGIFARRNDDSSPVTPTEREEMSNNDHQQTTQTTTTSSSNNTVLLQRSKTMMHSVPQWFEYSQQQRITTSPMNNTPPGTGMSRLRRTVSSDPYMRYNTGNSQFRFFDDLDISRFYPKEEEHEPQPTETAAQEADGEINPVEDIEVDRPSPTFSPPQTPPRNPPAPPPPPPPPPPAKQRRTFETIPRKEKVPPLPPSPPPSPPPQPSRGREQKRGSSRKRMNATKEIATAIVHLYSQRKRKRRQKSSNNFEDVSTWQNQSQFGPPPSPPPLPPPLPPHPPSAFKNWFKKGGISKKIHSFSSIPTPPPPPTRQNSVNSARKPPLPARRESGNESPMKGIPPPPPHPPFKVSQMKFTTVSGGYVCVRSAQSSRCGSPEIDGNDDVILSSSEMNGEDGERLSSVTCPSPDLNVKADSFIARHHDGWRLEKLNSWREKLNETGNGPTF